MFHPQYYSFLPPCHRPNHANYIQNVTQDNCATLVFVNHDDDEAVYTSLDQTEQRIKDFALKTCGTYFAQIVSEPKFFAFIA